MTAPVEVRVPQELWDGDDKSGSIVVWLYADGAQVKQGDVLAEILVEKVTLELEAPVSGTLKILTQPEVVINKGEAVATISPA